MAAAVAQQAVTAVQGLVTPPLKEGSKLPSNKLKENNPESASVDLATLSGKNVIVGVPGAFSPTCSSQAPGYVEQAQKFADKGVQGIYIVTHNDVFVVKAWKEKLNATDSKLVHFLADDTGAWTAATGLSFDGTALLGSRRLNRFTAIVEDGVVKKLYQEESPAGVTVTSADEVLKQL